MRKLSLPALFILTIFVGGCSFSTDLAVINLSDRPVEVRYRFKDYPGPFSPPYLPAIKTSGQMDDDSEWQHLSPEQYVVDSHSCTITVKVMPKTALRVARVSGRGLSDNAEAVASFPINEIVIRGAYGTMMLQGAQVRRSFAQESEQAYSITYK